MPSRIKQPKLNLVTVGRDFSFPSRLMTFKFSLALKLATGSPNAKEKQGLGETRRSHTSSDDFSCRSTGLCKIMIRPPQLFDRSWLCVVPDSRCCVPRFPVLYHEPCSCEQNVAVTDTLKRSVDYYKVVVYLNSNLGFHYKSGLHLNLVFISNLSSR